MCLFLCVWYGIVHRSVKNPPILLGLMRGCWQDSLKVVTNLNHVIFKLKCTTICARVWAVYVILDQIVLIVYSGMSCNVITLYSVITALGSHCTESTTIWCIMNIVEGGPTHFGPVFVFPSTTNFISLYFLPLYLCISFHDKFLHQSLYQAHSGSQCWGSSPSIPTTQR